MNNEIIDNLKDSLKGPLLQDNPNANVSKSERIISLATGAFILFSGITSIFSHPVFALGKVVVGGSLMQRGLTGYCPLKAALEEDIDEENETILISSPTTFTVS
ncbi:hypothetical protein ADIARSV_1178 [Arcticibacter svalbardensis MN12-7]|uniref:Inner membrane protein YgaP-like transmembrane domain-containing protein n=1 Tax=Arcticibacter svalbardensis MN12-7 TaxID=1150600 RepID=R9GVJ3_9SPHI|nr:DUF2892 domain-containing protein [Arcticibacter svalbardensis]EOR95663.1 hypothetical protein ADIARSV_1178 [Arcticibacter svalbardensis MN12-7]